MSLLLDTHYVFALAGNVGQMTRQELNFLATCPENFVVGAVSIWELRLKWDTIYVSGDRKGRLDPVQAPPVLAGQDIDFLPLSPVHVAMPLRVPIKHTDPFDLLLLVQVQAEGIKLLRHPLAVRAA